MSEFPPDPGGVFASDIHRRVAAHLPVPAEDPIGLAELQRRLAEDVYTPHIEHEAVLAQILDELAEAGYASYLSGAEGWRLLKAGLSGLSGPALTEVDLDGNRREPPPLEGPRLKEAEQQQERIAAEDEAIEEAALANAVTVAEEQLEAAKQAAGVG